MKPKKKKRGLNITLNLLIVACLAVLAYSLYNIYAIKAEYNKATDEYENMKQSYGFDASNLPSQGSAPAEEDASIDWASRLQELKQQNPAFVAWIMIPGTNIEYPVVQGSDNDYYLTHTFTGQSNSSGAIFLDYTNTPDFSDTNTIIYGHNMHNGTMFENLNLLLNAQTLAEHNKIYLINESGIHEYTIFSARQTDVYDIAYTLGASDKTAFYSHLPGGSGLTEEDVIITLSTCTYEVNSDLRVVVQAVLTNTYPL